MILHSIRHDWPEKAGFLISRPTGHPKFTFLHFTTPIQIRVGDQILDAHPGACIFFSPGTPQWFHSESKVVHNWMHAEDSLGSLLTQFSIPADQLLYPRNSDFISESFRKIEQEFFSDFPNRALLIDGYLTEFLIRFSRALQTEVPHETIPRETRVRLRSVRQEILSHPETRWTVAQMADLAILSPSRFHWVYKTLFGTSPMQDLIDARVGYAKSLLLSDSHATLPEIAEALGYHDQYHLIRQFKSVSGMTPGEFRKLNR